MTTPCTTRFCRWSLRLSGEGQKLDVILETGMFAVYINPAGFGKRLGTLINELVEAFLEFKSLIIIINMFSK